MCNRNLILLKSLATAVACVPTLAFAHLNIVTAEGRVEELKQVSLGDDVYKQIIDVGNKQYINHPVSSFAEDLPLGLALPSVVPNDWVVEISDELAQFPVTWEKTGNWDDVVVEISKRHDLVVIFDWNRHLLTMKTNDADMLLESEVKVYIPEGYTVVKTLSDVEGCEALITTTHILENTALCSSTIVEETKVRLVTDSLVKCSGDANGNCDSPKVDIEKLVLDTNWLDEPDAEEPVIEKGISKVDVGVSQFENVESLSPETALKNEKAEELLVLNNAIARDKQMKADYLSAYILHGDGSYEDFVNGGGAITVADPETEYVYVYKRGKLFNTINKWAGFNNYYVENEIAINREIDYTNPQDIKIKGLFKDVTTLLLNKYRKAKVPVNHKYYVSGGSSTLHILESKYESLYVK